MIRKFVAFIAVAVLTSLGAFNAKAGSADNLAVNKPFVGLGYSPFRGDQSPNYGTFPTVDEISYDLTNTIQFLASEIRTFGMDGTLSNIPSLCSQYGIPCFPCAFLKTNNPVDNDYELNAIIAVGNANYPTTRGLIVGTEAMESGYDPDTLASNIAAVRLATGGRVPVGTADVNFKLIDNPEVVSNCDFVMVNIYAYWAEIPLTNAVDWTLQTYQHFTNYFPGKRVIIGEVNWPAGGDNIFWTNSEVMPSVENQDYFLSNFVAAARSNNIEYFIFDNRDESWKIQEGFGTVEQNWGLAYTNDVKKAGLTDYLKSGFALQTLPAMPGAVKLAVPTFEGNPYSILSTTSVQAPFGSPATNFVGAAGTNQTIITLPTAGNPATFYRAVQNF